jgi:hypothetical protein
LVLVDVADDPEVHAPRTQCPQGVDHALAQHEIPRVALPLRRPVAFEMRGSG